MSAAPAARAISSRTAHRIQGGLVAALLALAASAWLATDQRMGGMDDGPGTDPGTLGFFLVGWVVMMAALMFPSVWPMALMFHRVSARRQPGMAATPLFLGGYLAAWAVFGLGAWGLLELVQSASVDALAWDRAGRWIAAGVLGFAALYQLTPLKDACLRRCRSPFSLVFDGFRRGRAGALTLGARHGAWCVGCCWGLMAALFALGVMNIAWMVLVAALIAAEKLSPWRGATARAVAALLAVLAVGLAVRPESVPGLTVPGSPAAMEATDAMHHEPPREKMRVGTMDGMRRGDR